MTNLMKELQVYHASDMLMQGLKEYRIKQKKEMEGIVGIKVFDPSSQSFNDKKNTDSHKLAERIVENDTCAIEESDIYVIDLPISGNGGLGTITELGQIFQMKRQAQITIDRLNDLYDIYYLDVNGELTDVATVLDKELEINEKILNKPVLIYSSDIRWNTTDMHDDMDRVPYSFNAYVYGVALYLTDGKGVISWEEVLGELEKLGASNV
ncbi:hypothetical protein [Staphylococcus phage SAP6]|nr:hypothetical protein [Staphylococcus phage StAP1]WAW12116.1 hypothetical protein [Staphylococcus phage SAP6]